MEVNDLKSLNKRIDDLSKGMTEIRNAILGDDFNPVGYQKRLDKIEIRLDSVEDFITKWKWILVGSIGLGGYGSLTFIQQIIELISKTINKH
jgi:tetrahydromethanopterin S-methyltransferase subunit G